MQTDDRDQKMAEIRKKLKELLVTNLNRRMARRGDDRRMVRTLEGTARAFLSDGFRRIDNEIVVDGLVPVAMKMGGLLKSVNVSDDYMNLTILFPKIEGEIRRGGRPIWPPQLRSRTFSSSTSF